MSSNFAAVDTKERNTEYSLNFRYEPKTTCVMSPDTKACMTDCTLYPPPPLDERQVLIRNESITLICIEYRYYIERK